MDQKEQIQKQRQMISEHVSVFGHCNLSDCITKEPGII